ncbi:hypothetical protein CALCODRAFT_501821 [Calocera cornea HHB12733]|uniref:Uncharacterized protein n=1 Tax=Calocera cornea HHB12733 TaxID=1353952 RepID=A0A165DHU2_9BASI|nr:hypothetical protein CALCODRAFT_501821 [Calocera cornea HHB12733]
MAPIGSHSFHACLASRGCIPGPGPGPGPGLYIPAPPRRPRRQFSQSMHMHSDVLHVLRYRTEPHQRGRAAVHPRPHRAMSHHDGALAHWKCTATLPIWPGCRLHIQNSWGYTLHGMNDLHCTARYGETGRAAGQRRPHTPSPPISPRSAFSRACSPCSAGAAGSTTFCRPWTLDFQALRLRLYDSGSSSGSGSRPGSGGSGLLDWSVRVAGRG